LIRLGLAKVLHSLAGQLSLGLGGTCRVVLRAAKLHPQLLIVHDRAKQQLVNLIPACQHLRYQSATEGLLCGVIERNVPVATTQQAGVLWLSERLQQFQIRHPTPATTVKGENL
jgi:hypothetical protein